MDSPVFTTEQRDKIINTLIFLGEKIKPLHVTKALKFFYLLDEQAVARFGIPFFGLKYYVWQYGPVAKDLYFELSQPKEFAPYLGIKTIDGSNAKEIVLKTNDFDDGEFSQAEIELLTEILEKRWTMLGFEMVSLTHKENELWHKTASRHNLLKEDGKMKQATSHYTLDFSELIENEKIKSDRYRSFQEFRAL